MQAMCNNNIMATTTWNVIIKNDYNEQCVKCIKITMHNHYNGQWTMSKGNEQW